MRFLNWLGATFDTAVSAIQSAFSPGRGPARHHPAPARHDPASGVYDPAMPDPAMPDSATMHRILFAHDPAPAPYSIPVAGGFAVTERGLEGRPDDPYLDVAMRDWGPGMAHDVGMHDAGSFHDFGAGHDAFSHDFGGSPGF